MTFYPDSFNPNDTTGGTLNGSGTTFTGNTNSGGLSRVHTGYNSGLYYFEFTVTNYDDDFLGCGLCTEGATIANIQDNGINAVYLAVLSAAAYTFYFNGTNGGTSAVVWSTFGVAVNLNTQKWWSRATPTAGWLGGGDPNTQTGGVSLPFVGTNLYLFAITGRSGQTATINFGATSFAGTVPSGFTAGWPTQYPAIPTGLAVVNPTTTTLSATWNAVSGPGTINYTVQYRQTGTTPWTTITGLTNPTYTAVSLSPATEYDFQVEAINTSVTPNDSSGFSSTVNGLTLPNTPFSLNQRAQNLKVGYNFINWLISTNRGIMGHLYKLTSAEGTNDYFTDLDVDINWSNITWKSNSLRFEGLHRKVSVGLDVDEQTLKIWASPTDTLFGGAFLSGTEGGLLDGAIIVRYRIIWPFVTGNVSNDISLPPIAVWPMFTGYTSAISKGGSSHVEMKVKSALHKLDLNMPRNYYQPACNWTLFSAGCTLVKSSFAVTGTIGTGPTSKIIPVSGGVPTPTAADGITNYAQGRLQFTSGVNAGLQVLIDSNDAINLYVAYTLTAIPNAGDSITFYPGCSKSFNTCKVKYNNAANFRGFDRVPPVMVSI